MMNKQTSTRVFLAALAIGALLLACLDFGGQKPPANARESMDSEASAPSAPQTPVWESLPKTLFSAI